MELEKARAIADEIIKRLAPYCSRIQVAGSIRRKAPYPKDIDLVLIPADPWNLDQEIRRLGPHRADGKKLKRILCDGVQVDLYLAEPETWGMSLLVRTGSANHNIKLATKAKKMGLHFSVARGIEDEKGMVIASQTEEEVFNALGLNYILPEERE
ncbi:unnamed protein product [marine sediment metagenome]|uniref:DNA polymerase beta thumb domain-containing protein n=1 Tax=marine sediment metagenome TaxID=412755 RepID=X1MR33_9ZZZZ